MTETQNVSQEPFSVDEQPAPATPSENDKLLAGLCYVSQFIVPIVLPAVFLLGDSTKKNPFLRHHAVQSLGLLAASVVFEIAATIVLAILSFLACVLWVLFLLPIIPFVYYGIQAFQGKYVDIPYLTPFLKQNKWL